MAEWVKVNDTRIDRHFLEGNIAEARKYEWEPVHWSPESKDHAHCVVCLNPIPEEGVSLKDAVYYSSEAGWLCGFCFHSFLRQVKIKRVY